VISETTQTNPKPGHIRMRGQKNVNFDSMRQRSDLKKEKKPAKTRGGRPPVHARLSLRVEKYYGRVNAGEKTILGHMGEGQKTVGTTGKKRKERVRMWAC